MTIERFESYIDLDIWASNALSYIRLFNQYPKEEYSHFINVKTLTLEITKLCNKQLILGTMQ